MENFSSLAEKSISFLGDSITAFNIYQYQVQDLINAKTIYNYGVPGSTISGSDEISFINRASQVTPDSDIVFVFGGTNDFHYNRPLGQMSDAVSAETFYAGVKLLIQSLQKQCPKSAIIFATPLQRTMEAENGHDGINALGYELKQYVEALLQVCQNNSIPVIDLFHNSRITVANACDYLSDGLHPNDTGLTILAEDIAQGLSDLYAKQ